MAYAAAHLRWLIALLVVGMVISPSLSMQSVQRVCLETKKSGAKAAVPLKKACCERHAKPEQTNDSKTPLEPAAPGCSCCVALVASASWAPAAVQTTELLAVLVERSHTSTHLCHATDWVDLLLRPPCL